MIGGIAESHHDQSVGEPDRHAERGRKQQNQKDGTYRSVDHLHRQKGAKIHDEGNRQVDAAFTRGDGEHLADAHKR